jgi:hypothetical protein
MLYYRGHLRSANLKGRTYFEIRCRVSDRELVAKGLDQAVSGTTAWVRQSIQIRLEKGKRAEDVALDVVVEGAGTVWVDNMPSGKNGGEPSQWSLDKIFDLCELRRARCWPKAAGAD